MYLAANHRPTWLACEERRLPLSALGRRCRLWGGDPVTRTTETQDVDPVRLRASRQIFKEDKEWRMNTH
jgi:hypothetical protein